MVVGNIMLISEETERGGAVFCIFDRLIFSVPLQGVGHGDRLGGGNVRDGVLAA